MELYQKMDLALFTTKYALSSHLPKQATFHPATSIAPLPKMYADTRRTLARPAQTRLARFHHLHRTRYSPHLATKPQFLWPACVRHKRVSLLHSQPTRQPNACPDRLTPIVFRLATRQLHRQVPDARDTPAHVHHRTQTRPVLSHQNCWKQLK